MSSRVTERPAKRWSGETTNQSSSWNSWIKDILYLKEGSSTRERLFALCRTYGAPSPKIALQFNGLDETVRAVVAGYGASFVSSMVVRDYVERGKLTRVDVEGIVHRNTFAVCTRRNEIPTAAVSNLIGLIREYPYRETDE